MRESIHKYFQVGIVQWMSYPNRDVLQAIRRTVADADFDAIEVRHFDDDAVREEAGKLFSQSHMKICYGAQPVQLARNINPNALDEEERQKAENVLLEALEEARALGAGGIAFLAGKWSPDTREKEYRQLLRTTRNVCDAARAYHMQVELEVFDYDMDKAVLIGPASLAAKFAADMRSTHANFGLIVDLSHFPTTRETSRYVVHTLRPYIMHLHFGNAVAIPGKTAYGDKHPRFGFPDGANDVAELTEYLRVLKTEGLFDARHPMVLSLEVKPWADEDEDVVLANTKRVLNRAWALLEDE